MSDRIAGALLLSAYGDAAGLPHEVGGGLDGEVGDPAREPLPVVDAFRKPEATPWNIWFPAERTAGMRGVVSDDTATKIGIVEPWLMLDPSGVGSLDSGATFPHADNPSFGHFLRGLRESGHLQPARQMAIAQAADWQSMFRAQQGGHAGPHRFLRAGGAGGLRPLPLPDAGALAAPRRTRR